MMQAFNPQDSGLALMFKTHPPLADRLVLFGGPDACRLGYLARPQAERLLDAGFCFSPHTLSLRGVAADIVRVARELAGELVAMAEWMRLAEIEVEDRGDLAGAVASALD